MLIFLVTFASDLEKNDTAMPRKNKGMWYEVHPTPAKGADGKNLIYVRPMSGRKLTFEELEERCEKYYSSRYGELRRAFDIFLRAVGFYLAEGYRIETPIGTFAPNLSLVRQITDPDEVTDRDVRFDGVEYNPGKRWNREVDRWLDGFRRYKLPNTLDILADREKLEQQMHECLAKHSGYITAGMFSSYTGLSRYSARKLLNEWTKGDTPKLLLTKRGKEHIYTEI